MFAEIASPEIIIVVAIVLVLLFGGSKISGLARSLGSAKREFQDASEPPRSDTSKTDDT